jgi:hypothetical protein
MSKTHGLLKLGWLSILVWGPVCGQVAPGPKIPVNIVRFDPDASPSPSRVFFTQAISIQGSAALPAGRNSLSIRVFEGTKKSLKETARTTPPEDGCVYYFSRLYPADYRAGTISLKAVTAEEGWLDVDFESGAPKLKQRRYVFVLESGLLPDGRIGIQATYASSYFDAGFEVVVYAQYKDGQPLPVKVVAQATSSRQGGSVVVPAGSASIPQPRMQGPLRRPACLTLSAPIARAASPRAAPAEAPSCDQFLGNTNDASRQAETAAGGN